ncbi:hypothetical protein [Herpetosiphon geysericola]|uniref:Uncharacterized protein n=1 Tax=Herpetosiphon geysericola TaxID=70996 RepID=A0A0P6XYT7_9CHLR|nr:hypothetical protein [Herpetosiphon geysericola]KPL90001.1 hypothetical protein SE18_08595 [Herpetosiphon geysericola]
MPKRVQLAVTAVRVAYPRMMGMSGRVEIEDYQTKFDELKDECTQALYEAAQDGAGEAEYEVVQLTMDYKVESDSIPLMIVSGTLVYSYERQE